MGVGRINGLSDEGGNGRKVEDLGGSRDDEEI